MAAPGTAPAVTVPVSAVPVSAVPMAIVSAVSAVSVPRFTPVAGTWSGAGPVGWAGRRVGGLLRRGHGPIIARTGEAHCSSRHMGR